MHEYSCAMASSVILLLQSGCESDLKMSGIMESAKKLKRCSPEQIEILIQSFGKISDAFFLFNFKDI